VSATSTAGPARAPGRSWVLRLSGALHARPRLRLAGLLSVPLLWLLVAYLGSLAVLLTAAFWSVDSFTGELVKVFTLDNLRTLLTEDVYRTIALRTLGDRRPCRIVWELSLKVRVVGPAFFPGN